MEFKQECLEYAGLKTLPSEWDGKTPFKNAIAYARFRTTLCEYAICGIDSNNSLFLKKSFGNSIITDFIKIYPYDNVVKDIEPIEFIDTPIKDNNLFGEISTENDLGEWGISGVYTAEQAYQWLVNNRTRKGNYSKKPEKIKEEIQKIKKIQNGNLSR